MKERFVCFFADETGVTAIEYGLIAGLIAGALTIAVVAVSDGVGNAFQAVASFFGGF